MKPGKPRIDLGFQPDGVLFQNWLQDFTSVYLWTNTLTILSFLYCEMMGRTPIGNAVESKEKHAEITQNT